MQQKLSLKRTSAKKKGVSFAGSTSSQGVDIQQLEVLLENLKHVEDVRISNLKGQEKEDFSRITRIVENTYGTDSYREVQIAFNTVFQADSRILPGTVKSYFVGCSATTSMSSSFPGCTPICAGSAPTENASCPFKVFMATKEKGRFDLVFLNPLDDHREHLDHAVVFIDETECSTSQDPPFGQYEASLLAQQGINIFKVFTHDSSMRNYQLVGKGEYMVSSFRNPRGSDVPTRQIPSMNKKNTDDDNNLWIIALIFLILLGVGGFCMYKRRKC